MRLATYIVRIYRLRKDKPRGILGVVEQVGVKGRKAFTDCDELWEILSSAKRTGPISSRPSLGKIEK